MEQASFVGNDNILADENLELKEIKAYFDDFKHFQQTQLIPHLGKLREKMNSSFNQQRELIAKQKHDDQYWLDECLNFFPFMITHPFFEDHF